MISNCSTKIYLFYPMISSDSLVSKLTLYLYSMILLYLIFVLFLEIHETIISGIWFEDIFIYLTNKNKLNYNIQDQVFPITTLNGNYYLLGFYQNSNKLLFMSKNFQIISYTFPISFVYYQSHILNKQYDLADKVS